VKNAVTRAFFVAIVVFVLGAWLHKISHNSKWIRNDIRTKIHLPWWFVKILQIHHFSEHSKMSPTFRTWLFLISGQIMRCSSSWEFSESKIRREYSADCGHKGTEVLRQLLNRGEGILAKMLADSSWKFWEPSPWPLIVFPRKNTLFATMDPSLHLPKWVSLFPRGRADFFMSQVISEGFHEAKLEDNSLFDMVDLMPKPIFRYWQIAKAQMRATEVDQFRSYSQRVSREYLYPLEDRSTHLLRSPSELVVDHHFRYISRLLSIEWN
jgi:hypothetical protein